MREITDITTFTSEKPTVITISSFVVLKSFDSKQLANTAHGVSDVRKNIGLSIKVCEISM